jgi:hypothetical protein
VILTGLSSSIAANSVQLRIRVIALENLVIALLAEAPDWQLDLAREIATYISPRPGFTQHPLTIHAAAHMVDLVERAGPFRSSTLWWHRGTEPVAPAWLAVKLVCLGHEVTLFASGDSPTPEQS